MGVEIGKLKKIKKNYNLWKHVGEIAIFEECDWKKEFLKNMVVKLKMVLVKLKMVLVNNWK